MSDNLPPDRYGHLIRAFSREIWAIEETKYLAIRRLLKLRAAGERIPDEEIQAAVSSSRPNVTNTAGTIAILPLFGTISQRASMLSMSSGGTSTVAFGKAFDQVMADPNVSAVIVEVDSPGGGVAGVPELADKIFAARGGKPVIAQVAGDALSAAYWIISGVDEIVVQPSGSVGSIGVFVWYENWAEAYKMEGIQPEIIRYGDYKAEINDWEPLTDEGRAKLQGDVTQIGEMFVKAVARGRGVSAQTARSDFGRGRSVLAKDAVRLGMADRIGTMDDTIQRLASGRWKAPARAAAEGIEVRMVAVADSVEVKANAPVSQEPPVELPAPEQEPASPLPAASAAEDGYDELATAYLSEWEQSDVETSSSR
jgi:signal peptide peptidase SppA